MAQKLNDQAVAQKLLQSQLVSRDDLKKALAVQAQLKTQGHDFSLAKVLVQSRMTTLEAIQQAISPQQSAKRITPPPAAPRTVTQRHSTSNISKPAPSSQDFITPAEAPTVPNLSNSEYLNPDHKATMQLSASAAESLQPKRFGRYQVIGKLGQGGMGLVYKARHEVLERVVALKTLSLQGSADPAEALLRFEREAKTMAKLQHAHIVPIYDIGGEGHQAYIAMEYVSGGSVAEIIARDGKVDPKLTMIYALKVARALEHAHKAGIIHRDLKPANILISEEGEPMIADFGLALISTEHGERLSRSGTVVGTLHYMPPEQLDSKSAGVDSRSDIYSLGATLFEMLTGYAPHNARSNEQLMYEIIFGSNPSFPDHCQDVPESLKAIILKCLERKAEHRYQSATELCRELSAGLAGKRISARLSKPVLKGKAVEAKTQAPSKKENVSAPKAVFIGLAAAFGLFFLFLVPVLKIFSDPPSDNPSIAKDSEGQEKDKAPDTAPKTVDEGPSKGDKPSKSGDPDRTKQASPKPEPGKKEPKNPSGTRETEKDEVKDPGKDIEREIPAPPLKLRKPPVFAKPHKRGRKPPVWFFVAGRLERELKEHLARRQANLNGTPDPKGEMAIFERLLEESGPIEYEGRFDWGRVFYRVKLCMKFYDYHLAARHLALLEDAQRRGELNKGQIALFTLSKVEWLVCHTELQSGYLHKLKNFSFHGPKKVRQVIERRNQGAFRRFVKNSSAFLEENKALEIVPGLRITSRYLSALRRGDSTLFQAAIKENQDLVRNDPQRVYFQVLSSMLTHVPTMTSEKLTEFMTAAISKEKTAPALALRGHFYSLGKKKQRALAHKDLNEAIQRAPRLAQAYRFRFYLHLRQRNKSKAFADLKTYQALIAEDQGGIAMQQAFEQHNWRK